MDIHRLPGTGLVVMKELNDALNTSNVPIGKNNDVISIRQMGDHDVTTRAVAETGTARKKAIKPAEKILSPKNEEKRGQRVTLAKAPSGFEKPSRSAIDIDGEIASGDTSAHHPHHGVKETKVPHDIQEERPLNPVIGLGHVQLQDDIPPMNAGVEAVGEFLGQKNVIGNQPARNKAALVGGDQSPHNIPQSRV
ncbi:receptor-like protein kinase [Dorcoceras hygrometricum]|uniref:Receptor-like protein kinase n=1 Tax=Dorcoceras hygrometricum TaxID=472368 RepID=A0A2Z7AVJ2_9LAMI|nr:receptor-like protein kinase [Dorcoceras hygrometricum]